MVSTELEVTPVKLRNAQYRPTLKLDGFFGFGKYREMQVSHILEKHPTYLCWLLDKHLDPHPKSEMHVQFDPELLTAILDKIIDDERCRAQYSYLLPEEYTAEKREAKRAAEREAAEKAAVYESMDWGGF
jgi:hypothetical protein